MPYLACFVLALRAVVPQHSEPNPPSTPAPESQDFAELSLEDLAHINIEVTSVSKRRQSVADSAAAVFVLTAEDIRRSGATSIPEVLRLAPGLEVARLDAAGYAVSARGFNTRFANKMLVLVDGRSVYTQLFSGAFWNTLEFVLEDIERIEVIRGPGAALWGANAVNGVINIITKNAHDTQGALVGVIAGNEDRAIGYARYGGALGDDGAYRASVKYADRDSLGDPGIGIDDGATHGRGDFRFDQRLSDRDELMLQGGVYSNDTQNGVFRSFTTPPFAGYQALDGEFEGAHVLGAWSRTFEDRRSLQLQASVSHESLRSSFVDQNRDTVDLDFQYSLPLGSSHQLMAGLGYRSSASDIQGGALIDFDPDSRVDELFSSFVQDEITLSPERFSVIVGTKVEHNDYTGFEIQPNARAVWKPSPDQTVWAAVSRAVRTPSQAESDVRYDIAFIPDMGSGFDTIVSLNGSRDFESEDLLAYELGYRSAVGETLSFDVALFYNDYDNLSSQEAGTPYFINPTTLIQPIVLGNSVEGATWGAELAAEWIATDRWRLRAGYAWLMADFRGDSTSLSQGDDYENNAAQNRASLFSTYDLAKAWELDSAVYYADSLPGNAPAYVRGDVHVGWRPNSTAEFAFGAQGLFHDGEREFAPQTELGTTYEVQSSLYLRATFRF